ncbi:aminoglycoside phosphotransferase family protein [Streptomyces sp. NPDC047082]|uniref:aminoglycoside phosphotransferase family protein n=1 Tax=Streptomyces sp. NPDC047082 TaxID=3155259 RepID=UPI003410B2A5
MSEPGDRVPHGDLRYDNVLTAERADRVAIDPKPLAGNPGFELLPAIDNRYDPGYTVRRFDALPDLPAIDRERPRAWTLGRCRGTVCGRSRAAALRRQCSWGWGERCAGDTPPEGLYTTFIN